MKSFESGRQPDPHYIAEMNGPDQADLTWIKGSTQEKYISEGFFGEAHTYILESENGDIELVRKTKRRFDDKRNKIEEAFTPQEIATQLEVHRLLKEHGIKTFDNFYTDGRSFYSTLLNKDGVTAISANTKNRPPNPESGDSFLKSLRIANYRELVNDIFNQVFLMVEAKICINHDSFFFLVPNNFTDTAIDIDFVIGDFDMITPVTNSPSVLTVFNLSHAQDALMKFLEVYAKKAYVTEYTECVRDTFEPYIQEYKTKAGMDPDTTIV